MDMVGGKPQALGPADFVGATVAKDGKRIAGWNAAGEAGVFDRDTRTMQSIPGMGGADQFQAWTKDGQALLVASATPWEARVYRVEVPSGKRTLLQTVVPNDRAGSMQNIRVVYAEESKTYAYSTSRIQGTLYVVEGLE